MSIGYYDVTTLDIAEIDAVEELYLHAHNSNWLAKVPRSVVTFRNLRILDLQYNQLQTLPGEICGLQFLEGLFLYLNRLVSLPSEIGQLTNLKRVDVRSNQLRCLPPSLVRLKQLEWFSLSDNPLPPEFNVDWQDMGSVPCFLSIVWNYFTLGARNAIYEIAKMRMRRGIWATLSTDLFKHIAKLILATSNDAIWLDRGKDQFSCVLI